MLPHQHAVIVGGGTMGADIAAIFAAGGYSVDIVQRPGATRGSLAARFARALRQLGGGAGTATEHDTLASVPWQDAGIVIETIGEDLAAKRRIFAELDRLVPADVPVTSNSSSFPISDIAAGCRTAQRMVNLHFFMPAHIVPLVEVVKSERSEPAIARTVFELMARLGRKPVMVEKDIPGFLANRLQHALMREAWSLIDRGIAAPADVDAAVRFGFGFRYVAAGPVLQKEISGLDVNFAASRAVYPDLCNEAQPPAVLACKVAAGEFGMKTGRGFYDWTPESIARARAGYDAALAGGLAILNMENNEKGGQMDDFAGVTQAKAVWDFSTGDGKIFLERIRLIDDAIDLLDGKGIACRFVVTLRGPVLKFIARDPGRTSFAGEVIEAEHLQKIHDALEALTRRGVKVEACLYAMRKRGVEPDNVLAFIALEENVFANAIALQNQGYAFMQVD